MTANTTVADLLFHRVIPVWIAIPFNAHFAQTAAVEFCVPAAYELERCLALLSCMRLVINDPTKLETYRARLNVEGFTNGGIAPDGTRRIGLLTLPLPPIASLDPATVFILEDENGRTRKPSSAPLVLAA